MIVSFTTVFFIAAGTLLCAVLLAFAAAWIGRTADRRALQARAVAETATARIGELEAALGAATAQLQEILAERERTAALPTRPSLREAVALSRHGASTDELVTTCRIGQSEARLIQMLYGTARAGADTAAAAEVH
jgi:hypothetical protein